MRLMSSLLFTSISILMVSQVIVVFPHIERPLFKYILSFTCLSSLTSFVLASKSQPGYLKRINSDQSNLLNLLKKVEPERICPACELVQSSMAFHCTACNRCIVDFDCHSLVVNNCISSNNRQYLILFLLSLLSFFLLLIIISVVHFEKPVFSIENMLPDFLGEKVG